MTKSPNWGTLGCNTRQPTVKPTVLARADELAVISSEEREAVELMLAVEMRQQGLAPEISLKQRNKNAYRFGRESFRL